MAARDGVRRESAGPFAVWADALLSRPETALSDILSGRGARGTLQLAEPDDFLADLLAQPSLQDRRDDLIAAIDRALVTWMQARVEWSPARVNAFGIRAYVAQFSEALTTVARLPLSVSPACLMEDVETWDDRFRTMRWPDDIDLLRQFDLALARHQPDGRLASRWFEACDAAAWAGPYWRGGLGTGLIGLRKMRDANDDQPERRVAKALARFGALSVQRRTVSRELQTVFRRHAVALTALYPRHDSHWKKVWADAMASLGGFKAVDADMIRNQWLRGALPAQRLPDNPPRIQAGRSHRAGSRRVKRDAALPHRYELDRVVELIENAVSPLDEAVWQKAWDLIRRHWDYARLRHHSFFAVRTTHNLCDRLLRKQPSASQLAHIHRWTLQAIKADAGNAYTWDLWAKVLAAFDAREASLDVRWEAARRFPSNVVVRTALVVALAGSGRPLLAEALFQETLQDFPNDAIRPQSLAEHLGLQGGWQSLRVALSEIREGDPDNPYAESFLKAISDEEMFGASGSIQSQGDRGASNLEQQVLPFLQSLARRTTFLEHYFAPSTNGGRKAAIDSDVAPLDRVSSEVELVVVCRARRRQGQASNGLLDAWVRARPASYSARLLLLSRGVDAHGADEKEMSQIEAEFPQHHDWNQWLGYAFVPSPRRSELRRKAREAQFWEGRLIAVYPQLAVDRDRSSDCQPEALRRLFEDVALANAEVGLPSTLAG